MTTKKFNKYQARQLKKKKKKNKTRDLYTSQGPVEDQKKKKKKRKILNLPKRKGKLFTNE